MKTKEEICEFLEKLKVERGKCIYHDTVWHGYEAQVIILEWVLE